MNLRHILIGITWVVAAQAATAQTYGGWLTQTNTVNTTDMLFLSQWNYSLGTARSAGLGGAVSALGADLSALSINPAGTGMYRREQFGISAGFGTTAFTHDQRRGKGANSSTRAFMDNMGYVFPASNSSNGLVASNYAVTYNKLADLNYSASARVGAGNYSILDLFTLQLNGLLPYLSEDVWNGITTSSLGNQPFSNTAINPQEWGAVLSYLTFAVDPANDSPDNALYAPLTLRNGATVVPELGYTSRGYIGQYDISWGGNINNVLYLGASIGFQDIKHNTTYSYREEYGNNTPTDPNDYQHYLWSLEYNQITRTSGFGFNAKVGIIVRPIPQLRLSVAYHTPTAVALHKEYEANMSTLFLDNSRRWASSQTYVFTEQSYSSPSRMIVGAAFTIGNFAAISADWERVWYGSMVVYGQSHTWRESTNTAIRNDFRTTNNLRIGGEIKPTSALSLRAGFGYYDSPISNDGLIFNAPVVNRTLNYSLGAGFALGSDIRIDLAYVVSDSRMTMTDLYYYTGEALVSDGTSTGHTFIDFTSSDPLSTTEPLNKIHTIRHSIIASLTVSF